MLLVQYMYYRLVLQAEGNKIFLLSNKHIECSKECMELHWIALPLHCAAPQVCLLNTEHMRDKTEVRQKARATQ